MYVKLLHGCCYIFLAFYANDILIARKDPHKISKFEREMNEQFQMKDLRQARKILGMNIKGIKGKEYWSYHRI